MSLFKYKIKKADGQIESGEKEANDKFVLYKEFHSAGSEIITIEEGGKKKFSLKMDIKIFGGIKTHDKIIFARNLGSMIEAGLSLSRALNVMIKQSKNKNLKEILEKVVAEISSGKTLSDAMLLYPKVFSPLFISMVKAGEQSGGLAEALKTVALQMERMYNIQRKVKCAMVYPTVIFIVMIVIAILMLIYIVPTLTATFNDLNVDLPMSTKFIIGLSDFLRSHYLIVAGLALVFGIGITYFLRTKSGKRFKDLFVIKIPSINQIVKEVDSAKTTRTLSSLLSAGVDVVESLRITEDVMQNSYYKKVLHECLEKVQKGEPISSIFLLHTDLYPVFVGEMMSVGEETGKISEMLRGVADFYENEVEQKTKDISSIIEPILMVIIGIGVGFFAIAMLMPMYSLADKM